MDPLEQVPPGTPTPAMPPPGPTPKNKIGLWLTGVAVAIIAVSLLFSNGGTAPPKSKLYTGQQQQPASPTEVGAFEAATAAEAERARKQAEALRRTEQQLAAFQQTPTAGATADPTTVQALSEHATGMLRLPAAAASELHCRCRHC